MLGGINNYTDITVNVFNPKKLKFSKIDIANKQLIPKGRCFHSMTAVDNKLVIFGGETSNKGMGLRFLQNETWIFDLKAKCWIRAKDDMKSEIAARKNHKACLLAGKVVITGGVLENDAFCRDICAYDPHQNMWVVVHTQLQGWRGRIGHSINPCYRHEIHDLYSKPSKGQLLDGSKVILKLNIMQI